ncbi:MULTISPECIES: DNA polymerase III subunit beta [unclassified Mycoplasma]|uniref:DNA polymerase III subunit beta family protein n=1 Tax=unclassified Mycoplasma TaxID=2683645 RepID=UPI00211C8BAC|nr:MULTISPECIES: DNA polymerase III subunit beta [unclassified Mycoplasma]UUM19815.1 DNA polymerase III subunit beta [Mycoplasma sp. 1578d]UUM24799.1 DNA polymerase III subunit beta [Mycoplasma sp. 3686d]
MKFTILKNKIEPIVEFLSLYIDASDSFMPFRCLFFNINSDFLTITAQSATISARKKIDIEQNNINLEEVGKVLINASILKNIIKKFNKYVTFKVNENSIDIYEGTTKFTLTKIDIHQYPQIDFNNQDNRTEVNSAQLEKTINNASIAASISNDKLNALVYKCINVSSDGANSIRFVSTDSYRLSTESIKVSKPVEINLTIDARNLKRIVTKDADRKVFMFFNQGKFGISYTDTVVQTLTTNLNYMDIWNLFNFDVSRTIKIEKQEFLKLISKALFYSSEKSRRLQFTFNQNEVKVVYEVPEIGIGEAQTSNYTLEGPNIEIDLDFQYIKDAISVLENGIINIFISKKEDRLLLISENNNYNKQLITPLRRI